MTTGYCDQCYEMVAICPRAGDDTQNCVRCVTDPLGLRLPNGGYDVHLSSASVSLRGLADGHVDRLLNYVGASRNTTSALPADQQTIYSSKDNAEPYDGLSYTNLQHGVALVRNRPATMDGVRTRMEHIMAAATQAQVSRLEAFLRLLDKIEEKKEPGNIVTTATSYKEATMPIYMLWIAQSKRAIQGQDLGEEVDAKTMFDPVVGKTFVPFEKVQKFKTPAHLFRAFALFKEAVTVLFKLAPCAWSGFEAQVFRAESSLGFHITQQFVGEVLRRLDMKEYPNIGALLAAGEHNRILDDLRPPLQPINIPSGGNNISKRIKLGPVTKQGEFCALIKDKDGHPLVCNQFKDGKPCTAGVATGQGHDAHAGKCAYHHP